MVLQFSFECRVSAFSRARAWLCCDLVLTNHWPVMLVVLPQVYRLASRWLRLLQVVALILCSGQC
jgi:hypothetical protein